MSNIIAIVGRPNVGKSTLFNRLTVSRQAIVEESSGVTRDRHYGRSDWNGVEFSVIDTGGYVVGSDDVFEEEIRKQVVLAIEEADAILFMVDARMGLTGMDEDVAQLLRKAQKKVFLVANKVDNPDKFSEAAEFYALGLGEVFTISAMNGGGTGDLLDKVCDILDKEKKEEIPDLPRFAVVGRPNVGKSSLVNAFLGDERNIVTSVAGTTRDSIYTRYNNFGFEFLLVDTAGLRKKGRVKENIEFYSVMRSVRAIENSDVCFLMVDATQGFESQDQNIFHLITRNKKGVVVVVNKWDLVDKGTNTHLDFEKMIREQIAPFSDVPIVFTSVPKKQRIFKALEWGMQVYKNKSNHIATSKLNEMLLPIIQKTPPPAARGRYIKVKYITQLKTPFPAFAFFCNMPQYVKDPYKRFLENKIREQFNFTGIPIQIFFRKK
ncbi:MAG: ribosome biogenesis GTPase Der [Bacteroidetes bacterium]|nr:ribosome biogenesis GTPase Der [Bacteroidota bacterium]